MGKRIEIDFIGGTPEGPYPVNLFFCPAGNTKTGKPALIGTPGMNEFCDTGAPAAIRGLHVVGDYLYAVAGDTLFKIDTEGTATAISGSLTTTTGFVWMADNGTELMVVDSGVEGYIYDTVAGGNLTAIADTDFPTPGGLTFQDGYFIVTEYETNKFFISASYDGTSWDALDFASAEGNPDNAVTAVMDHLQLWIFGEETTEVYYNSGNADFPFERVSGAYIERGTRAPASVAKLDGSIFFLDDLGMVRRMDGYNPVVVSTRWIEKTIASYSDTSDAIGWSYTQDGHAFYVLTFPTGNATWAYDAATKQWHQRRSYPLSRDGSQGRHRGNCYAFFDEKHIVGDFEDGKLYELDTGTYTDAGETIRRVRVAPPVQAEGKNIFHHAFEVVFEAGVGLIVDDAIGSGQDPQAMLEWSDDGGHTYGNEHWVGMGKIGEYGWRARWRRLGRSRERMYRLTVADPVKVVVVGARLDAAVGSS